MSIKDMLRVYPHDKLSHYQWATWLSTPVGIAVLVVGLFVLMAPIHYASLAAALATVVASTAIGIGGEWIDKRANDAAKEAGVEVTHVVSEGDVLASALGGLPAAITLAFVAALTWPPA